MYHLLCRAFDFGAVDRVRYDMRPKSHSYRFDKMIALHLNSWNIIMHDGVVPGQT